MTKHSKNISKRDVRRAVYDLFVPHFYDFYKNNLPIEDTQLQLGLVVAGLHEKGLTRSEIYHHLKFLEAKGVVKLSKSFQNNIKKFIRGLDDILETPESNSMNVTYRLSPEASELINELCETNQSNAGAQGDWRSDYGQTYAVAHSLWNVRDGDVLIKINVNDLYLKSPLNGGK